MRNSILTGSLVLISLVTGASCVEGIDTDEVDAYFAEERESIADDGRDSTDIQPLASSSCMHTDYNTTSCTIQTTGASGTGATGITGTTYVWFDWGAAIGSRQTSVSGRVCVTDTWANGRGVKVKLDFHKEGMGSAINTTNYIIRGPYKDTGGSCSSWYDFSAANGGGIDLVKIEWGDTWSNCSYCYKGSYSLAVDPGALAPIP